MKQDKEKLIISIAEKFSELADIKDEYNTIERYDNNYFMQLKESNCSCDGRNVYEKRIGKIETEIRCLKAEFYKLEPDYKNMPTKRLLALMKKYRQNSHHVPFQIRTKRNLDFWKNYFEEQISEIKWILNSREHVKKKAA